MQRANPARECFMEFENPSLSPRLCRITVVIASFLPALWLALSGPSSLAPVAGCVTCGVLAWAANSKDTGQDRSASAYAFETSARPTNSRIGVQTGPDRFSSPAGVASVFAEPARLALSFHAPEKLMALAHSWQFDLRTALEPRAPSSVS